jgi:hypothetical protein
MYQSLHASKEAQTTRQRGSLRGVLRVLKVLKEDSVGNMNVRVRSLRDLPLHPCWQLWCVLANTNMKDHQYQFTEDGK